MASSSSPTVEVVKEAIEKDGFYYYLDPTIGKQVDEFAKEGYPFKTEKGLGFIKHNTLDDKSLEKIDTSGLLEIPHKYLHKDNIEHTEVEMKDGALVILDDRLGFTIVQGFAITFCFMVEEELNKWAKMKLPNSLSLKKIAISMTSEKIGMNFEFPK
ncbi:hypothetical protein GP486_004690 [Trichoglossum hirsutum]|uniref:Uncharacterized protein n=1 Tax=Trichoglossum hirsutum TaxID=265104 RepID=A0A9P8RP84_9PEZI|nr:hypothetical protein GP486_004690 [Trichoglossum hirsutum]